MHHALSVSIAKQEFRAHHIRSNPSHIILVLFIPIEFPRLLAKREIIANAKNVCSNVVKARTLSAAKVGISFRTTKHMERKMSITRNWRTVIVLQSIPTDVGAEWFFSAKLPPDSHRCLETHLDTALYVNKRGNKKTLQTIHKPYILLFIPLIFRALRNV